MKKPIINFKIILECVFYYIISFSLFVFLVMDKIVYDEYNRLITVQDFFNAPTDVVLLGVVFGLIFSVYPILREFIIREFLN